MLAVGHQLVLVLTEGGSLKSWRDAGVLTREWALYERLAPRLAGITVVSFGGGEDEEIARTLPGRPSVVANTEGLPGDEFAAAVPRLVVREIGAGIDVVVKTNQFQGGAHAVAVTRHLRSVGIRTAVLARGGYDYSRGFAMRFGPDSVAAIDAAAEERDLLLAADHIMVTTPRIAELTAWRHHLAQAKLSVVPNYVVADASEPGGEFERDPNTVLAVGRLDPQKRIDLLIEACSRVPDVKLKIVGSGELEGELRCLAADRGVAAEFLGQLEQSCVRRLMRTSTIFAQCSNWEGHPKTVLEAQLSAMPVVATHAPGLSECIDPGYTGLLVNDDPSCIATALRRLITDRSLCRSLGESARAKVESTCALDTVVEMELEVHVRTLCAATDAADAADGADAAEKQALPLPQVRWPASAIREDAGRLARAFGDSIHGLAKRLDAVDAARFLFALDAELYRSQGEAAINAEVASGRAQHPKHRLTAYHEFFCDNVESATNVLDVGCGFGDVALDLADRRRCRVTGVDLDAARVRCARREAGRRGLAERVTFVVGDAAEPATWSGSEGYGSTYDSVVLSNVLEHIDDRVALLRSLACVFRPARVLIRVPAIDRDWRVPYKRELGVEWRLDDDHRLEYTEDELRSELAAAELVCQSCIHRWGELYAIATPIQAAKRTDVEAEHPARVGTA